MFLFLECRIDDNAFLQYYAIMISDYMENKLKQATYKILADGTYFGEVKGVRGVWASAKTLEVCRKEL